MSDVNKDHIREDASYGVNTNTKSDAAKDSQSPLVHRGSSKDFFSKTGWANAEGKTEAKEAA